MHRALAVGVGDVEVGELLVGELDLAHANVALASSRKPDERGRVDGRTPGLREWPLAWDASEHVLRRFDDEVSQGEDRRHADGADHRADEGEHDVAIEHAESDHDDAE
jgi:hypothetical protein